jgi:hypothetical protein
VWAGSLELDRRLAEGVAPANSPELALRARQLASPRSRRELARALTDAIDIARRPYRPWTAAAPIVAAEVAASATTLELLARDVETLDDAPVRALALVSFLVCDAGSPLHARRSPVTVLEIARRARAALAPF